MKFGKLPAKHSLKTVALSNYTKMSALAFPPVRAWERPIELGMLGNDMVGDCTVAGFYHMLMTQRSVAQAGNPLIVTTEQALADYGAITGYDPTTGANDNGAYCSDVLAYYLEKGRILGKASVDFHNVDMVKAAINIFGGLYRGFTVPQSTVDELQQGIRPTFRLFPLTVLRQKDTALMMRVMARSGMPSIRGERCTGSRGITSCSGPMKPTLLLRKIGLRPSGSRPAALTCKDSSPT